MKGRPSKKLPFRHLVNLGTSISTAKPVMLPMHLGDMSEIAEKRKLKRRNGWDSNPWEDITPPIRL
jgi:hypothetical protein